VREVIEEAIIFKARAILRDQQIARATRLKYAERFSKRTGAFAGAPSIITPRWWGFHPHFNPAYCIKHSSYLSRTIWRSLVDGTYQPIPAVQFDVPKKDGSFREIMGFAIPDAAVANVFHRSIRVLNALGIVQQPLLKSELLSGEWYNYPQIRNDARLPSFVRGWRAARRYYLRYGLKSIEPPSYYSLLY